MKVFRLLTVFFIFLILAIIISADFGLAPGFFRLIATVPYSDTIAHFTLLGILSLLFALSLRPRRWSLAGLNLLRTSLVIAAIFTLEEFSQIFLDNRSFSLLDLSANYAGIFLFGELGAYLNRLFHRS